MFIGRALLCKSAHLTIFYVYTAFGCLIFADVLHDTLAANTICIGNNKSRHNENCVNLCAVLQLRPHEQYRLSAAAKLCRENVEKSHIGIISV